MLDFVNIENSRQGLRKLVELNEMFLNSEVELEPCKDILSSTTSATDRFMSCLVESTRSQLKAYAYFLQAEYKDDYLDWISIDGREGYERVMLEIHQMKMVFDLN